MDNKNKLPEWKAFVDSVLWRFGVLIFALKLLRLRIPFNFLCVQTIHFGFFSFENFFFQDFSSPPPPPPPKKKRKIMSRP